MVDEKNILEYWLHINQLSPISTPKGARPINSDLAFNKVFKEVKDQSISKYEVVCGDIWVGDLFRALESTDERLLNDLTSSFLFFIHLDKEGKYLENTFKISHFAYLILNSNKLKDMDYQGIETEIDNFCKRIDENIDKDRLLNFTDLRKLKKDVVNSLFKENLSKRYENKLDFKLLTIKDDEEIESNILQMDFYSKDLEWLIKEDLDNSIIKNIILKKPISKRTKVTGNKDFIKDISLAKNMPLAKWPSKYNPALMRNIAINISTKSKPPEVFSVNGPPGTGKTTLLKEIIADTIVKKAKVISGLDPDLDIKAKSVKANKFYKSYYQLPEDLKKLGIIVASNNNAAVENISIDLLKNKDTKAKETLTDLFDTDINNEIYFTKYSDDLYNSRDSRLKGKSNTWGLISAPYGNSKNIENICKILPDTSKSFDEFRNEIDPGLDFKKEKEKFLDLYKKVEKLQNNINIDVEEIYREQGKLEDLKISYEDNRKKFWLIRKLRELLFGISLKHIEESERYIERQIKDLVEKYSRDKSEEIPSWARAFTKRFWNEIEEKSSSSYSQVPCPWAVEEFNILREKLFQQSLILLKSFILNSNGVFQNLKRFKSILKNEETGYSSDDKAKVFKEGFHSLNLLIPVLSTTFASVQNRFKEFNKGELGILIIDEAGQATPFSPMGLLHRCHRAI